MTVLPPDDLVEDMAGPAEPRFSEVLIRISGIARGDRITIGEMIDRFGRRGHGALLIVLGAPNLLPLPLPGLSMLSGLPLLLLTVQITLGMPAPWFPAALRRLSFAREDFRRMAAAIATRLLRVERIVRPRWSGLTTGLARRLLGAFGVVLAVTLFLPLPLGNALPGLALALIGLALLERDGAAALAAVLVGVAGLAVVLLAGAAIAGAVLVLVREVLP